MLDSITHPLIASLVSYFFLRQRYIFVGGSVIIPSSQLYFHRQIHTFRWCHTLLSSALLPSSQSYFRLVYRAIVPSLEPYSFSSVIILALTSCFLCYRLTALVVVIHPSLGITLPSSPSFFLSLSHWSHTSFVCITISSATTSSVSLPILIEL